MAADLKPGDLVMRPGTSKTTFAWGMVIGIRHPREGQHMGCEERIQVIWSEPLRFGEVCDCELLPAADF